MLSAAPSAGLSRLKTNEVQRQNYNLECEYSETVDKYLRQLELTFPVANCLERHQITPILRSRMVDWMIEVLTNFKCEDQTFFVAINLLDRYAKASPKQLLVNDLHLLGVTAMFIASKYEDILPLKMKIVYEKIAHKRLEIEQIKTTEL